MEKRIIISGLTKHTGLFPYTFLYEKLSESNPENPDSPENLL